MAPLSSIAALSSPAGGVSEQTHVAAEPAMLNGPCPPR